MRCLGRKPPDEHLPLVPSRDKNVSCNNATRVAASACTGTAGAVRSPGETSLHEDDKRWVSGIELGFGALCDT